MAGAVVAGAVVAVAVAVVAVAIVAVAVAVVRERRRSVHALQHTAWATIARTERRSAEWAGSLESTASGTW